MPSSEVQDTKQPASRPFGTTVWFGRTISLRWAWVWCTILLLVVALATFALITVHGAYVEGPSLFPTYHDGDKLIFCSVLKPRDGDIVAATIKGEPRGVFKRYRILPNGQFRLCSDASRLVGAAFEVSEVLEIKGRVFVYLPLHLFRNTEEAPDIVSLAWSPDSQRLAYLQDSHIFLYQGPRHDARLLATIEGAEKLSWIGEGILAKRGGETLRVDPGNGTYDLWNRPGTMHSKPGVIAFRGKIIHGTRPKLSPDGTFLAYQDRDSVKVAGPEKVISISRADNYAWLSNDILWLARCQENPDYTSHWVSSAYNSGAGKTTSKPEWGGISQVFPTGDPQTFVGYVRSRGNDSMVLFRGSQQTTLCEGYQEIAVSEKQLAFASQGRIRILKIR